MDLKKQLNIYTWIWVLYLLQGIVYPAGLIGQALFLIIMGYSLYIMMRVISIKGKPKFMSFLTLLVALYFLYGAIRILKGPPKAAMFEEYSTITYIKTYLLSLSPIYVYYYFARKGVLNEDWFRKYIFIFMALAVVIFLDSQLQAQLLTGDEEITNNSAYSFVAMLPVCLFWQKKPLIQYLLIIVAALLVLISMKRGAILVFVVSIIPFLYRTFKNSKKKGKVAVLLGIVLLAFFTYSAVMRLMDSSVLFRLRIEQTIEGKTSNRDIIYEALWDEFSNNYSGADYLLGRGADATIGITGKFAHNDWLETLIDQGVVGVIVFFLFWLSMFFTWIRMKKGELATTALLIIFISGFVRTFFSMSIGQMPFYYTAVLGFCLAMCKPKQKVQRTKI